MKYALGVLLAVIIIGVGFPSKTVFIVPPAASATLLPQSAAPVTRESRIKPGTTLYKVASCETTGNSSGPPRQFNSDGSILWGKENNASGTPVIVKRDCGYFQINTKAHAGELTKLGLHVCTSEEDNITYALMLNARNGLSDWSASASCWAK